ncbi:MAG: hypothetical protein ABI330_01805 [Caldimonas sp.]
MSMLTVLALAGEAAPLAVRAEAAAAVGAASGASSASISGDRYEGEWAYRVRPWRRQTVIAVTVVAAGLGESARDAAGEPEPCATFRPSEMQIRRFLANAKQVSQRGFLHETDWSACYATGHAQFRGGARAEWMVQRYGAGYLTIDGTRYYLACSRCQLGNPQWSVKP